MLDMMVDGGIWSKDGFVGGPRVGRQKGEIGREEGKLRRIVRRRWYRREEFDLRFSRSLEFEV